MICQNPSPNRSPPPHRSPAEEAGGTHQQDQDQHQQRNRQAQLRPEEDGAEGIGAGHVLHHADDQAAHHGAGRAVQTAKDGGGEREQDHPQHGDEVQEEDGRHQDAAHRANHGGEDPTQHEHLSHVDPHEARGHRVLGRGPYRQSQLGVIEQQVQGQHDGHGDDEDHQLVLRDAGEAEVRYLQLGAEWGGRESLGQLSLRPDERRQAVEYYEQAKRHYHRVEDRAALHRPDHRPLYQGAYGAGEGEDENEDDPVVDVRLDERPAHECDEERHLALGEVDDVRAAVNEDDTKGDEAVDAAGGHPRNYLAEEEVRVFPGWLGRQERRRRSGEDGRYLAKRFHLQLLNIPGRSVAPFRPASAPPPSPLSRCSLSQARSRTGLWREPGPRSATPGGSLCFPRG